MPAKTFLVPKDHTLEQILGFSNELASHQNKSDSSVFDFQSAKGFATPFGMLYIGFAIRQFIQAHPEAEISAINFENQYYLAHMGYFQCCGFDVGKLPGEAKGSDTYLPVTILKVADLVRQAAQERKEVGELIEERSNHLAQVLTQESNSHLVDMLTYTLREMLRNVVEHSRSEEVAYCAQYLPSKKQAEIAILDTGVGIKSSLSHNPHLKITNDHEALNLAVMPGISGKMYKGVKKRSNDVWQNSGYGLFAVSRLCGHEGKFLICSGDTAMTLKPDKKEYHDAKFHGTALRLNLSTKNIGSLSSTLSTIIKEGHQIEKSLKGADILQASTASKMLSSEFGKRKTDI